MDPRLLLVLTALLVAACGPSEERASDIELKAALDRLRDSPSADGSQRRLDLTALEQIQARTPAGTDAKTACVTAYRGLLDAEDAVARAEVSMKTAQALHNDLSPSVLQEVAEADRLLRKAREAMPACDAAAGRLAVVSR